MNKLSKQKILKGLEDIKQLECNPEYKTKIIDGMLELYNKAIEKNNRLESEREHIINNLEVDLNRNGIYSQAKGQISQILEYYKNNEKYILGGE